MPTETARWGLVVRYRPQKGHLQRGKNTSCRNGWLMQIGAEMDWNGKCEVRMVRYYDLHGVYLVYLSIDYAINTLSLDANRSFWRNCRGEKLIWTCARLAGAQFSDASWLEGRDTKPHGTDSWQLQTLGWCFQVNQRLVHVERPCVEPPTEVGSVGYWVFQLLIMGDNYALVYISGQQKVCSMHF